MITDNQVKKLKRLIDEFCDAKIDCSWMGSYEPEDQVAIEDNVKLSLDRLNTFIEELKR